MDTLFLAVTALALVLVLVMAVVVSRMWRDERRRSDARVAALAAMANQGRSDARQGEEITRRTPPVNPVDDLPLRESVAPPRRAGRPTPPSIRPAGDTEQTAAPLFAQPQASTAWGRRMVIIVPLALIVVAAGVAFYPASPDIAAPPASSAANAPEPAAAPMPLELLSLRHAQEKDRLMVTGLVQNPKPGAAVAKVFVTAFVFGADGTFLASGRAPLDFTTLAPGDESPFVVTVPVKGDVARYRVGFRGEDGRVIAHVDRRNGGAIARASEERP
jgi:hypothetical protein